MNERQLGASNSFVKKIKTVLIVILIFVASIAVTHRFATVAAEEKIFDLVSKTRLANKELKKADNKITSINSVLSEQSLENDKLKSVIIDLKARPDTIRYITKIETVLKGTTTTVYKVPPAHHLFKMKNGLTVASFKAEMDKYHLDTFDLSFQAIVVHTEESTGVTLQVSSSFDKDKIFEVKVDTLKVTRISEHKKFTPRLSIGGTLGLSPLPDAHMSLLGSLWHPSPKLDLLSGRISLSSSSVRVGIDAATYNISDSIPILTNLWIGVGASYGTDLKPSLDFTISGRL